MKVKIAAETLVEMLISEIGDDPTREGLKGTPRRVVNSWQELYSGYSKDPKEVLKTTFVEGACRELVILKDVSFYSTCEHHLLPFFGKVHIGYIPDDKVVGISKLARLVEVFARRLQIQERFTTQIAESFLEIVQPKGVMIIVEAQHFCMKARGVKLSESTMKTSAIRGCFEEDSSLRGEFLSLIKA